MNKSATLLVTTFLLVATAALLSGCGGSSSPGTIPGGGAPAAARYGSLTLSDSGSAATGTIFNAVSRLAISQSGMTVTQWYNIDLAVPVTYPYVVLVVFQDNTSAVATVTLSRMVSESMASDQWVTASAPSTTEVSTTAGTISFNNLQVPGYASASTTTSLTLNGTLSF